MSTCIPGIAGTVTLNAISQTLSQLLNRVARRSTSAGRWKATIFPSPRRRLPAYLQDRLREHVAGGRHQCQRRHRDPVSTGRGCQHRRRHRRQRRQQFVDHRHQPVRQPFLGFTGAQRLLAGRGDAGDFARGSAQCSQPATIERKRAPQRCPCARAGGAGAAQLMQPRWPVRPVQCSCSRSTARRNPPVARPPAYFVDEQPGDRQPRRAASFRCSPRSDSRSARAGVPRPRDGSARRPVC